MPTTIVTSHGAPIAYGGHHPGQLIVEHHAPAGSSPFVIVRAIDRCGEVEIRLEPAELDELIAQLTAARDTPRLTARREPTIVELDQREGVALVRTAHEWGVLGVVEYDPDESTFGDVPIPGLRDAQGVQLALSEGDAAWFEGERAEVKARADYAHQRNLSYCEPCGREVGEELRELGEDGPQACDACHAEAAAEFATADVVCVGDLPATAACGWDGKGASVEHGCCPECEGEVEELAADARPTSDALAQLPGPAIPLHVVHAWTAEERAEVRAHVEGVLHATTHQGAPVPAVPACLAEARAAVEVRAVRPVLQCAGGDLFEPPPCGWVGTLEPTETVCPQCSGEVEAVQIEVSSC